MIIHAKTRYIVPFCFGPSDQSKRDYIQFLDLKTDKYGGSWKEDTVKSGEQDLYEYVLNSFDDAGEYAPGNIAASFKYVPSDGEEGPVLSFCYTDHGFGKSDVYDFDIEKAGMMLFVSGTGFFWYEFGIPTSENGNPMGNEDFVRFNNRFKELNYEINTKRFKVRGSDSLFSMGNWVAEVVCAACEDARFFSKRKNILSDNDCPESVPDKALIFNYAVFDEAATAENIISGAYHLTKGYNQNYRPPVEIRESMFH